MPMKKGIENPSNKRLKVLPKAKPPIKRTLLNVADLHRVGFHRAATQYAENAKYNPIIARKTFARLTLSTEKSSKYGKTTPGLIP